MSTPPKTPIYEGKAKKLFEGPEPGTLIAHYKDDATAFNNKKKGTIQGKGIINNKISEFLMSRLNDMGIPTHFIRGLNMREQLVRAVDIIPLEVIVRNYAAGSFAERFGAFEGEALGAPLIEFCLKDDRLGDPFIAEDHIFAFGVAQPEEVDEIRHYALRINDFLSGLFYGHGIRLIDLKLEFGRFYEGEAELIVLADEISPDTCRLWDLTTNDKMDKDRFRRDLGKTEEAYREVARRLGVLPSANVVETSAFGEVKAKAATKKPAAKIKPLAKTKAKPAAKGKPSPKKKIMQSFRAEDMVTIVLMQQPQPEDVHLTLQSFTIGGERMIPLFTSRELFQQSLQGRDFPYPVFDIRFDTLMQMVQGDENIIVNPGTTAQFAFNVADLEGHS